MADLSLDLCGVKLKNPIIAASGTFGFGREYDELYDIGQLGGISVKGLSLLPRTGNPPSRIAETPSGMLNSVGLQNPGVESFIENDLPWLLTKNVAVIANITGTSVEQYVQMAERLAGTGVHLLEMNISCPNVHEGGVAFGVKPESVYAHHEGGEGGGQTAVDRQADPECIRHHGKRAGCRRGGARTRFP